MDIESTIERAPDDIEALRRQAQSLAESGEFDRAVACWQRIEALDPDDPQAARTIGTLIVAKCRQQAGLACPREESSAVGDQTTAQRAPAPEPQFALPLEEEPWYRQLPSAIRTIKRTPIQQLEVAVREHASIPEIYLRLAALYLEKDRDYDAENLLAKGRTDTDDDARVREMWEDVTILRLEKKVASAQQGVEQEDSEKSRAALAEARSERDRVETEIFVDRCQREPQNAALRYQLGLRLKQAGKVRAAFQQFQEALHDPKHASAAALEMGECSQQFADPPQVLRYYRLSAESARQNDHAQYQQQALYRAAQLAERLKLLKLAQRYLAELLRCAPNHEAATALMQDLQSQTPQ
jgi:tetratricopeptide (TPR) repeat protein